MTSALSSPSATLEICGSCSQHALIKGLRETIIQCSCDCNKCKVLLLLENVYGNHLNKEGITLTRRFGSERERRYGVSGPRRTTCVKVGHEVRGEQNKEGWRRQRC